MYYYYYYYYYKLRYLFYLPAFPEPLWIGMGSFKEVLGTAGADFLHAGCPLHRLSNSDNLLNEKSMAQNYRLHVTVSPIFLFSRRNTTSLHNNQQKW